MKNFYFRIKLFGKIFLKSKIIFRNPKKTKILFYDIQWTHLLEKILKTKATILHTRGEVFYFPILLKTFFKYGFRFDEFYYQLQFIDYVKPKLVVSLFDNFINFYRLKNFNRKIKFVAIQNGFRNEGLNLKDLTNNNTQVPEKSLLKADLILTFNKKIESQYKKYIKCKTLAIGSFKNNFVLKKKIKKIKNSILYISPYRPNFLEIHKNLDLLNEDDPILEKYSIGLRIKIDFELPILINDFCTKNNIKLYIALWAKNKFLEKNEIIFYKKILKGKFKFINRTDLLSNYKTTDKYDTIVCAYSTLGYEALGRENKVAFFAPDINRYENSYNFGWPNNFERKGFFYSDEYNYSEVNRVLTNLIGMKDKEWCKKIRNYRNKVMLYDKGNKKFLKSIKTMIR